MSGKTNGRIPKLLEALSPDEVMFLINAIYFRESGGPPFGAKDTRDAPFHGADGRDRAARLIWLEEDLRYDETEDHQAVDLLWMRIAFGASADFPSGSGSPARWSFSAS